MGICCCCEEQPGERVPNHSDFRNRQPYYGGPGSAGATATFTANTRRRPASGQQQHQHPPQRSPPTNAVPPPQRTAPPDRAAGTCQFCGHIFDPSLLDGHQETCRINLKKKASEMRTAEGRVVNLRVFELNPSVEYDDDQVCVVCMAALRSYAIVPCGHLIACGLCARQLESCPMCRRDRQGLLFVDPTEELKTLCKSCANVIHPAYFEGHREVCALHMRQLAAQLAAEAEAEVERAKSGDEGQKGAGIERTDLLVGGDNAVADIGAVEMNARASPADPNASRAEAPPSPALEPSEGAADRADTNNADNFSEPEANGSATAGAAATPQRAGQAASVGVTPSRSPAVAPHIAAGGLPPPLLAHACIECRRAPAEVAFIPCGHTIVCAACAPRVGTCPSCLVTVESVMQTFK